MTTKKKITRRELGTTGNATSSRTASANKKATHTPGCWTVFGADYHDYPGIESETRQGRSLLSVVVFGDKDTSSDLRGVQGRTKAEAIANANLIAAAPELLAALNELIEGVDEYWMTENPGAVDRAEAAIKKAEGQ